MRCPLPAHSFHYVSAALACQHLGRVGELQRCPLLPRREGWGGTGTGWEGAGCLWRAVRRLTWLQAVKHELTSENQLKVVTAVG